MNNQTSYAIEEYVDSMMDDFSLITTETFDRFLVAMLAWYKEEAIKTNEPPNVYELLEDHEPYTKIFYDLFIESLAIRHEFHNDERPEFDVEQRSHFAQLFRDNIDVLYDMMIYDYERLLRGLNLVYIWDSRGYTGNEFFVKNEAICEVW